MVKIYKANEAVAGAVAAGAGTNKNDLGNAETYVQVKGYEERYEAGLYRLIKIEEQLGRQRSVTELKKLCRNVPVFRNNRLKHTAGYAKFRPSLEIHLHPVLLDKARLAAEIQWKPENTFFHELAHILAFVYYKHTKHEMPWRRIMLCFNYEPQQFYPAALYTFFAGYKGRLVQEIEQLCPDW